MNAPDPNTTTRRVTGDATLRRHLNLAGASNFRDLGGYETQDGRRVRWRRIFRSNHLGKLTDDDLAVLHGIGLRKVIDFRSQGEIDRAERCRLADRANVDLHLLPIDPGISPRLKERIKAGDTVSTLEAQAVICEIYRRYIHQWSENFRSLFAHLINEGTPLVFHCSAGKDRTGVAAALILTALGVPRDVITEDYLLTRQHWKIDPTTAAGLPAQLAAVLTSVDESFLASAFAAIDEDFGGIGNYLRERLDVDAAGLARLHTLYLED